MNKIKPKQQISNMQLVNILKPEQTLFIHIKGLPVLLNVFCSNFIIETDIIPFQQH